MKTFTSLVAVLFVALGAMSIFAQSPSPAASGVSSAGGPPDAAMMQQMMEIGKLNENHKMLAELNGNWTYTVKFTPGPGMSPQESKGTAVRKSLMDGRFISMDVTGKMQMPGPDGKPKEMDFKGHGLEGYDNAKKKFVGTWVDSMGTGIMTSMGDWDPAAKMFTFTGEYEAMPGMKEQFRETLKVPDKNHMQFEMFENQGGQESKVMEINYTRAGSN